MSGKYEILITKTAKKHKNLIKKYSSLEKNVLQLLDILKENPYQNPPPYEALVGNLKGLYSRRINNQHRFCIQN